MRRTTEMGGGAAIIDDPMRTHLGYGTNTYQRDALARLFQADQTTLIPLGIRSVRAYGNDVSYFLFEEPPTTRTVHYHHAATEREWAHTVWTPWTYYAIYVDHRYAMVTHMYFRKDQLRTVADRLYLPCFPNVYATERDGFGKVCYGGSQVPSEWLGEDGQKSVLALDRTIASVISAWWGAPFNRDILAFRDFDPFLTISRMADITDTDDDIASIDKTFAVWAEMTPEQFLSLPFTPVTEVNSLLASLDQGLGGRQTPGQQLARRVNQAFDAQHRVCYPGTEFHLPYNLPTRATTLAMLKREKAVPQDYEL